MLNIKTVSENSTVPVKNSICRFTSVLCLNISLFFKIQCSAISAKISPFHNKTSFGTDHLTVFVIHIPTQKNTFSTSLFHKKASDLSHLILNVQWEPLFSQRMQKQIVCSSIVSIFFHATKRERKKNAKKPKKPTTIHKKQHPNKPQHRYGIFSHFPYRNKNPIACPSTAFP